MNDVDLTKLGPWLASNAGLHGAERVTKFSGGQSNPTYLIEASDRAVVLRRKPLGKLLKSAHAIDREFRVQRALAATDVPVAQMVAYCADETIIGSEFYIMEQLIGETHDDPRLPDVPRSEKIHYINNMGSVLSAIHQVDLNAVGLSDFGPRQDYFRRQLDRWSGQYKATETEKIPAMDQLIAILDRVCPAEDGKVSLVHGDYRIDNLLFDRGSSRILAVLDWELSTLGHPYADLAGVIMQWANAARRPRSRPSRCGSRGAWIAFGRGIRG